MSINVCGNVGISMVGLGDVERWIEPLQGDLEHRVIECGAGVRETVPDDQAEFFVGLERERSTETPQALFCPDDFEMRAI